MAPFEQQIFAALQSNGMICKHRTLQYFFVTDKQKRDTMDAVILERLEGQITNIFGVMNWESMSNKDRKQTSTTISTDDKQLLRNNIECDLYLTSVDAIDNEKGEVLLSSFFEKLTADHPIPGEFPNVQLMNWKKEMPIESGSTIETILRVNQAFPKRFVLDGDFA